MSRGRRWIRRDSAVPNIPTSNEDQVSEHVPWENLTIPPQQDRRVLIYAIAAGLVVAVLGVVVVRQLIRPAVPDALPVTTVATEPVATTSPPPETVPEPLVPTPGADLIDAAEAQEDQGPSEADLRAVDSGAVHDRIAGRAEWLVLEYFTVDPSEPWRERVEAASGLRLPPEVEPDTPAAPAVSYVEWARTRSVEQTGDNTFLASVLVRRLVTVDGAAFERLPTEWVEVQMRVEPDGMVRAVALPRITDPPQESLDPLPGQDLEWFTDSAGISWPSSPAHRMADFVELAPG